MTWRRGQSLSSIEAEKRRADLEAAIGGIDELENFESLRKHLTRGDDEPTVVRFDLSGAMKWFNTDCRRRRPAPQWRNQ